MMTIEPYYLYKLLLANGVLLAVACYAIIRFERRCREIEAFWASPTGLALADAGNSESREQMRQSLRLEERVEELQLAVKAIATRGNPSNAEPARPIERNLPLENAVRMARSGASIEDLTRSCGLNVGEAQLMQKLHSKVRQAAAAN